MEKEQIIAMYRDELVPMKVIAAQIGCSRMRIWRILNSEGVDTKKGSAPHIKTVCTHCGKETIVIRSRFRKTRHAFCSRSCFYSWLNRSISPLLKYRHGMRIARKLISKYFIIQPGMVVHHEDRNEANNSIENLRVFASQGDHVRYHRDFVVYPLWDGSKEPIKIEESSEDCHL